MRKIISCFILLLALSACSILPEREPINYFSIILDSPPSSLIAKRNSSTLKINAPTVAEAYETTRFYIRDKGEQFYVSDAERFLSKPADLIGEALRQWFSKTGPWKTVLSPNSIANSQYQMIVYIPEIYADFRETQASSILSMEVSIMRSGNSQVVYHREFRAVTPIETKDANGLAASYKAGLTSILTQLTTDLQRSFGGSGSSKKKKK